jgi:hypothetical protein
MPLIAGGIAAVFVAGAGLALVMRYERGSEPKHVTPVAASPAARTAVPIASAGPALPVVPAIPPPVVHATAEAPWAELSAPDLPAAAPALVRERATASEAGRPVVAAVARSEGLAGPPRSPGEPYIRLASVDYSPMPGRRTASLMVNGGSPVVLHEGQSASDLQVTLILPDRVYLRRAGQVFAIHRGE